jgi:hypothetical protein
MDHEELAAEIEDIFNPELDEDYREWPQERLKKHHALDFTYMEDWLWEGATSHPNTRLWPAGEPGVSPWGPHHSHAARAQCPTLFCAPSYHRQFPARLRLPR